MKSTRSHRCNQVRNGEGFDLHIACWASTWDCQLEAKVEPGPAGADADGVEHSGGRYSQVIGHRVRHSSMSRATESISGSGAISSTRR